MLKWRAWTPQVPKSMHILFAMCKGHFVIYKFNFVPWMQLPVVHTLQLGLVVRKPVLGVSDKASLKNMLLSYRD